MVPDAKLGGDRRGLGGAVLLVRETPPQKDMVLDASFVAEVALGLETRVYRRNNLTGEEGARKIWRRKGRDENRFSTNVLEMLGML